MLEQWVTQARAEVLRGPSCPFLVWTHPHTRLRDVTIYGHAMPGTPDRKESHLFTGFLVIGLPILTTR